ncbi:MAG: glycogen synthase [Polyangiales bacterium]
MQPIVLHVAAELAPFHKSGGLGDVLGGLPPALGRAGVDVRIVTGLYGEDTKLASIGGRDKLRRWPVALDVSIGGNPIEATIWEARTHGGEATTYFVEAPHLSRGKLYGYRDDAYRFAILSKAAIKIACVLQRARRIGAVAAIHAHDWHAALALWYARFFPETRDVPTVFTIHNLAYQGQVEASSSPYLDIGWDAYHSVFEHEGVCNLMKGALVLAWRVTTVSPTYAREIQTREHGMRLDGLLRWIDSKLVGLLNGIDEGAWDPAHDVALPARFSIDDLEGKEACRQALRFELGLYPEGDHVVPIVGAVSRLTHQKGIDQLCDVASMIAREGGQIIVLGTGERSVEERLHGLAVTHPGAVVFRRAFDERLAHRIYAGSDLFAMPSRFEPCGLTQLYAMRYGARDRERAVAHPIELR